MAVVPEQVHIATDARQRTVLVVDDDDEFHKCVRRYLGSYRVLAAGGARHARRLLAEEHVDLVLLDIEMPAENGIEAIPKMLDAWPDLPIIMITSHATVENVMESIRRGASDFLEKRFDNYQILELRIELALARLAAKRAEEMMRAQSSAQARLEQLERSTSAAVGEALRQTIAAAAGTRPVLFFGERGVGKSLFARYLHRRSVRANASLVEVKLGAHPRGRFESILFGHERGAIAGGARGERGRCVFADGGTLAICGIEALPLPLQERLVHLIERREVHPFGAVHATATDIRLLLTSTVHPDALVASGRLHRDLRRHLGAAIEVPPLARRRGDVPALVDAFARHHAVASEPVRFAAETLLALEFCRWKDNVRELERLVADLAHSVRGRLVEIEDLPAECAVHIYRHVFPEGDDAHESPYVRARNAFERRLVRSAVEHCGGDKQLAAELLGVSLSTVKEKVSAKKPTN